MKNYLLLSAVVSIAAATSSPVFAQMSNGTTPSGSMGSGSMQSTPSNSMQPAPMQSNSMSGSMSSDPATSMSASEMKKMKACQAMPQDAMMKNARCTKMMKMHPEMMQGSPNGG